jgi:hypothetical protein
MKPICALLLLASYTTNVSAVEVDEVKFWHDGKITPEQPFKGKVVAAGGISPWSGETVLYLRENVENPRFLKVRISFATGKGVRYLPVKDQKSFDEIVENLSTYGAALFIDPVDINRFVWASPIGGVGSVFGDKDLVKVAYTTALNNAEQSGADQAAPASGSYVYRPVHNSNTFGGLFSEELNTIAHVPTYTLRLEGETATLTNSFRSDVAVKFTAKRKENFLILSLSKEHPKFEQRKLGLFILYQKNQEVIHWDGRMFKKEKD